MRFILILCAVLALSSIASESADQKTKSKQVGLDKHQGSAQNVERATNNQPEKPSPFQTELIEALRTIAKQNKTAYEQGRADEESWNSPAVLVSIGLLIVGGLYTFFAWRQWQVIRKQTEIAQDTVKAIKLQAEIAADTLKAIERQADIADTTLSRIERQASAAEQTLKAIEQQAKIAEEGLLEIRKAINAASQSTKVAIAQSQLIANLERPWLVVKPNVAPSTVIDSTRESGVISFDFSVKNIGKSPAFLVQLLAEIKRMPYPIPEDQKPEYSQAPPFPKMAIAPGDEHGQRSNPLIIVDPVTRQRIIDGDECIVFYGFVAYYDSLHESLHETRFCSYWHAVRGTDDRAVIFIPAGHPNFIEYT